MEQSLHICKNTIHNVYPQTTLGQLVKYEKGYI